MRKVEVNVSKQYSILIASGLMSKAGDILRTLCPHVKRLAIVTDEHVAALYLAQVTATLEAAHFQVISHIIPAGEASKNAEQFFNIHEWLGENKITNKDVILAFGGGVVGDITGFVASTHLDGIPYVQMPTSLVAMTDSSVGGKTAIDLRAGKNLAGSFYQPLGVLCDVDTLNTLPTHVFCEGMAEVIKHGMIRSADLLTKINQPMEGMMEEIVAENVTIKRDIVQKDEFDRGERQLLNLGHTVGHAIETLANYKISHGHAVAIGMVIETRAAVKKNLCPPECLAMLIELLERYALPTKTNYTAEELFEAALHDKKLMGGTIALAVPRAIGDCELMQISASALQDWIASGLET